jgi:SAM-dependent methyltransferase
MSVDPKVGDAFGRALLDALRDGDASYIVERIDGYVDVESAADNLTVPSQWPVRDAMALDLVSGRVLDVGAGAGRHSLALQDMGADPVALDTSPGAIDVCRRRGVERTFVGDVFDLLAEDPRPFDAALFMGNNLGLLGSPAEARELLAALGRLLTPDGVVVGTGLDPHLTDDEDHRVFHERNRAAGRLPGQLTLRVRYGYLASDWFNYLFVSPEELRDLADECGWWVVDATDPDPIYLATLRPR